MDTSMDDELEAEWEEATQRLNEAQEKGAELVDLYEEKLQEKDAEIAKLKSRKPAEKAGPCKRCRLYRIETLLAFALWVYIAQSAAAETRFVTFLLCFVPLGGRLRSLQSQA